MHALTSTVTVEDGRTFPVADSIARAMIELDWPADRTRAVAGLVDDCEA